jgi:hypothetical protein
MGCQANAWSVYKITRFPNPPGPDAVLILYGGVMVSVGALVLAGVSAAPPSVDWLALRWHVWPWDMWFLIWGLLLAIAIWLYQRWRLVNQGDMSCR